ncbi:MAG: host attachment protein [Xanthomonadales bacterium]|nr:host attachment protein [Xanthomonadales bacterium]
MAKHNCIIVADSSRARFFHEENKKLQEVAGLSHTESRTRSNSLTSDRPGRSFDSAGAGRHAMGEGGDPQSHEARVFAREVSEHLRQSQPLDHCEKIALIAPPQFLGLLRKSLDRSYLNKVACEVDKNLVTQSPDEIREYLPWGW